MGTTDYIHPSLFPKNTDIIDMNACLIIPAGGQGQRFGGGLPKQFEMLGDVPILIQTIRSFEKVSAIKSIVVATMPHWIKKTFEMLNQYPSKKIFRVVNSGTKRQDTINNALQTEEAKNSQIILIHDAVRPFPSLDLIRNLITVAQAKGCAIPAVVPTDTIKILNVGNKPVLTLERDRLRAVQTPQVFQSDLILEVYRKAMKDKTYATDDSALFEMMGKHVEFVEGEVQNIKITTQLDYKLACLIANERK